MIARLLELLCGLFWGLVVYRVIRYPAPHISVNLLYLAPLFAAVAAFAIWRRYRTLAVIALLTVAGLVVLDQCNILVGYEVWLKRGMPRRPF